MNQDRFAYISANGIGMVLADLEERTLSPSNAVFTFQLLHLVHNKPLRAIEYIRQAELVADDYAGAGDWYWLIDTDHEPCECYMC